MGTTRRRFLGSSLVGGAGFALGCSNDGHPILIGSGADGEIPGADSAVDAGVDAGPACPTPLAGATMLSVVPLAGAESVPFDRPFNVGLDGRLYTDLSRLDRDALVVPNERFYIRTRYPDRIDPAAPWTVSIGGTSRWRTWTCSPSIRAST